MDHPPSTDSSPRTARRALTMGLAAVGAIAAPIALVASTAGGPAWGTAQAQKASQQIHTMDASQAVPFVDASGALEKALSGNHLANAELTGLQALVADSTATTLPAPLPTTTTVAPAPAPKPKPAAKVAPAPAPTPAPAAVPASTTGFAYGDPADPATWDRLAQCEAGGNWARNSGNGYYGGLQFSASTWRGVGGTGLPHQNSREVQIEMGRRLQARSGWGQWPACTRKLHYR